MPEYSNHQKKIIERYYDQRESIMLNKLQELVTELYLADTPNKQKRLWERAETAMKNLKIKPTIVEHIVGTQDASVLAKNVQEWLKRVR